MVEEGPVSFFSKPPQRPVISAPPAPSPTPPRPVTTAVPAPELADAGIFSRFVARSLDSLLIAAIVGILLPTLPVSSRIQDTLVGYVALFVWVFVEAALLAWWGTTPGKWMFGINVCTVPGTRPAYGVALHRSFSVWWRGLSAGIPLANLISSIRAAAHIKKHREAVWDAETGLEVHQRLRVWRLLTVGSVVLGVIAVLVLFGDEG
jgi:uncharacterized RDD family membrane protein YckC